MGAYSIHSVTAPAATQNISAKSEPDTLNVLALLAMLRGNIAETNELKMQEQQKKKRAGALLRTIMERVQNLRGRSSNTYGNAVLARKLIESMIKDFGGVEGDAEMKKVMIQLKSMANDMKKLEETLDGEKEKVEELKKAMEEAKDKLESKQRQLKILKDRFDNTTWWPWNWKKKAVLGAAILLKTKEVSSAAKTYNKAATEYNNKAVSYQANIKRLDALHMGRSEQMMLKAEQMEQEADSAEQEYSRLMEKLLNSEVSMK